MKRTLLLAAAVLSGCMGLDFVPIEPLDAARRASIVVHVMVADPGRASTDTLRVVGELNPGQDAKGRSPRIVDDTLHVAGRAIAPTPPSEGSDPLARQYEAQWAVPRALLADGQVEVRLPRVAGRELPFAAAALAFPAALGSDSLVIAPGAGFELRVRPAGAGTLPVPSEQRWNLSVERGERRFAAQGEGPPPERIFVPADWIPADTARLVRVQLGMQRNWYGLAATPDSSQTVLAASALMRWRIRVASPAAALSPGAGGRLPSPLNRRADGAAPRVDGNGRGACSATTCWPGRWCW
ncbi:MAG: hypothetical protein ICV87_03695 [Gemmatimonadetes bacterium]|nr:hypothetical protein [Gemmatimonadota bacterium]